MVPSFYTASRPAPLVGPASTGALHYRRAAAAGKAEPIGQTAISPDS